MPGAVLSISPARLSQGTILITQTHRQAAKQESEPSGSHPQLRGGWSKTSQRRSARRISEEPEAGPRSIPPRTLQQPAVSAHGAAAPSAGQKSSTSLPSSPHSARSTRPSGSHAHMPPACHRSSAPRTTPPKEGVSTASQEGQVSAPTGHRGTRAGGLPTTHRPACLPPPHPATASASCSFRAGKCAESLRSAGGWAAFLQTSPAHRPAQGVEPGRGERDPRRPGPPAPSPSSSGFCGCQIMHQRHQKWFIIGLKFKLKGVLSLYQV